MASSIANDKKMALFFFFKHEQKENVFPTARLTSPKKASRQIATSVGPRAEGALQIPTISHRRNFYFHRRGQGANKSITEYTAELQQLATNCEFGEYLNSAFGLPYSVSSKGRWPNQAIRSRFTLN